MTSTAAKKVATKKGKAVATRSESDLVNMERPSFLPENSDRGQENVGIDDLTIPRLDVLQDLSPQRKPRDPEYIEGAEEGMLWNTVTRQLYGDHVMFVPVYFRKEFVIWKAMGAGGGFMGAFNTEAEAKKVFAAEYEGETYKPTGSNEKLPMYEIVDIMQHFGMIVHPESTVDHPVLEEIVISMSKSKAKVSRKFNTMIKMAGGDRFSRVYSISSVEDENAAGQSYYNLKVEPVGYVSEAMYRKAEQMYKAISSGKMDVVRDVPRTAAAEDDGTEEY